MRSYKRRIGARKYADYLDENLWKAVDDVKGGKLTVREAAVKYGIPKSTVSRKVLGQHTAIFGRPTVFSHKEESTIYDCQFVVPNDTSLSSSAMCLHVFILRIVDDYFLKHYRCPK